MIFRAGSMGCRFPEEIIMHNKKWLLAVLLLASSGAHAYEQLVQKQQFQLASYTTVAGANIAGLKVGYETYGQLNAVGDNAVFIPHFYSGNSHAAGRYQASDAAPGYWHGLIGSGKAIDTDKYFVISADTLANLNVKDPNTITTGPASIDPASGKPYGMRFPLVTAKDFVRVHKALLDQLGVKKLQAVVGASGGGIQAFEWAVEYPDMVERIVPVISPGLSISPYALAMLDAWAMPVRLDPAWQQGDYYSGPGPQAGLAEALKLVTLAARHHGWAEKEYAYRWAEPGKDPAANLGGRYLIESALDKAGAARAQAVDANSLLYTSRAYQRYNIEQDVGRIKARVLLMPARSDLLFPPELSHKAAARLKALGKQAEVAVIEGDGGHLDGLFQTSQLAEHIGKFLKK